MTDVGLLATCQQLFCISTVKSTKQLYLARFVVWMQLCRRKCTFSAQFVQQNFTSALDPTISIYDCRYVQEVHDQHLLIQLSSAIRSRVSVFDSAEDPEQLSQFAERFSQGQPIQCRVSQVSFDLLHALRCNAFAPAPHII